MSMYIEKRKLGTKTKYYLVYSYRENNKVNKIRKYLGQNLSKEEFKKSKLDAKKKILLILEELSTKIFNFSLTENQIRKLNSYVLKIPHFEEINWTQFTEEFVYNTNAIEGSTVQLADVKNILENRKRPIDEDEIEAKNVANAVYYIRKIKGDVSLNLIKRLHKICFQDTKPFAGSFRTVEVFITNAKGEVVHVGVPAKELDDYLNEMIEWYKKNKHNFKPLILAAIIHNQFEHIHPFQDGNGRVGRLLLNFILIKSNYPPINVTLQDRMEYYQVLNEYSKNHDLKPSIKFFIELYNKALNWVATKRKK